MSLEISCWKKMQVKTSQSFNERDFKTFFDAAFSSKIPPWIKQLSSIRHSNVWWMVLADGFALLYKLAQGGMRGIQYEPQHPPSKQRGCIDGGEAKGSGKSSGKEGILWNRAPKLCWGKRQSKLSRKRKRDGRCRASVYFRLLLFFFVIFIFIIVLTMCLAGPNNTKECIATGINVRRCKMTCTSGPF